MLGIKNIFVEDLKEEFVRDYVFPMFELILFMRVNIARYFNCKTLNSKRQIEIAREMLTL